MIASRELPARHELIDYGHAVAGHAGTLSDAEGELFIKPCTRAEIDFYQVANRRHASFADLMPLFMGTLSLSDAAELSSIDEAVGEDVPAVQAAGTENKGAAIGDNIVWKPNGGGKIPTEEAAVLENAAYGFKQPNIVDVKLGVRLWADDAPLQKRQRCDKITSETTHGKLGFRIAGMRVYKGSEDPEELGEDGYRTYDRDYGRLHLNDDNITDGFRRFIFNKAADIDEELGKAVCKAFLHDLRRVEEVLSRHESRMYSSSLLFVFEGDGKALEAAIERNNDEVGTHFEKEKRDRTTLRVDSGIALDDGDDLEEDVMPVLPRIYTLKLIDFAHAQFTPGQGPDENALTGVRSLISIFEELSR